MDTIKINSQNIAYRDNKTGNKAIVFIHGNSLSSATFQYQFGDKDLNRFRLVAPDLPGHGLSAPSDESEKTYNVHGFIDVLMEFTEKLELQGALFVGHSLGGHILLNMSGKLDKAAGFVIFGTPPIGDPPDMTRYFLPNPAMLSAYKPELSDEEIKQLAAAFVKPGMETPELLINDIKRSDKAMRGYLGASLTPEKLPDEVAIIQNLKKPIAVFHGEEDQLVNGAYIESLSIPALWKNEIQYIQEAGHCCQYENPESFNNTLLQYISQI